MCLEESNFQISRPLRASSATAFSAAVVMYINPSTMSGLVYIDPPRPPAAPSPVRYSQAGWSRWTLAALMYATSTCWLLLGSPRLTLHSTSGPAVAARAFDAICKSPQKTAAKLGIKSDRFMPVMAINSRICFIIAVPTGGRSKQ